jgi:hypothetical protein
VQAEQLWDTHLRDALGPLVGHASDGDARRRKLQLEDYCALDVTRGLHHGDPPSRYALDVPGFLFSARHAGGCHQLTLPPYHMLVRPSHCE